MISMKFGRAFLIVSCFLFLAEPGLLTGCGPQQEKQSEQETSLEKLLRTEISTASKYRQLTSEAAASVAIITAEEIERFGYRTLDEILFHVPGFYVTYDRNYAYVGTRGFGRASDYNNRILLMINGNSINEAVYGASALGTDLGLHLGVVERIEIVYGPGSALYGTSAVFAVVNVITKKGGDVNGICLSGEAGSFGRAQAGAVIGKKYGRDWEIVFSGQVTDIQGQDLYFKEFDAPETNNGLAQKLDWDKSYGLFGALAFREFKLQSFYSSREKSVPTASWETIFNDGRSKTKDEIAFLELQWDHDFGTDKNIQIRGYYDEFPSRGWYPYEGLMTYDKSEDAWLGGEIRFRWDSGSNNRIIAGGEYQRHPKTSYRYWSDEEAMIDLTWPFSTFSLFAQDEFQIRKDLSLTAGIRRDQYSYDGGHTSPRIGVVYHPSSGTTLKLLFGSAFRAPGRYEMYFEDILSGYKKNLDLKPEVIQTLELRWEERFGKRLFGFASLYTYRMDDLIDWVFDPVDELIQSRNIGNIRAWGGEIGFDAQLGKDGQAYGSYSYQRARDNATGLKLSNSPSHLVKAGISGPLFKSIQASAQFVYESARLTVRGTETRPFFLANAVVSTPWLWNHTKISLQVRNLFAAQYSYPGGLEHIQDSIRQDGRNISLRMDLRF